MSKTPQRGLGRGLDALFHNAASEEVRTVPIGKITANRFQPRKHFDEDALAELSESVRQYGVLQPIVVRRTMTGYELVAGERRCQRPHRSEGRAGHPDDEPRENPPDNEDRE